MTRRPPRSPLFPYPTLSRSAGWSDAPQRPLVGAARPPAHHDHVPVGAYVLYRMHEVRQRAAPVGGERSEEHTSELQSQSNLVCRLLLEKKKSLRPVTPDQVQ